VISQAEIRAAVTRSGFEALELGGEAEDTEAKARASEITAQRRLLITGLAFTIPLFLLRWRWTWLIRHGSQAAWTNWLMGRLPRRCSSTWAAVLRGRV